ncbi:MAG: LysM peptidoglycan-binding domain-containing protein [Longimicrobiales bacterium]
MVRSASAVLALLILPGLALGQQPQGSHTVVNDDTLWDLAVRFYQDPFQWRVIYDANRDSIADPNLIFPNEVFVIPGLAGQPSQTVVIAPSGQATPAQPMPGQPVVDAAPTTEVVAAAPSDAPVDLVQFGFRQARPAEQVRTIFHTDTASQREAVVTALDITYTAVTRDAVYSAPWVIPIESEPENAGTVAGFAAEGARASTIRSFDRVRVDMPTPARVGAELQIFRVMRTIEGVGEVVTPTGVLTVSNISEAGVVGVVTKEYDRIQPGDFVRPVPSYTLQPGQYAEPITGGSEAMIMGFAGRQDLNDLGHVAFLDLGSNDGVTIGDEFILFGAAIGAPEGSLQVVGVTPTMSAARILSLVDDVFHQGVVVRLARKMR